jgi:hypothetical protein
MPGRGHNHSENVTPEQSILPAPDHHDTEPTTGTPTILPTVKHCIDRGSRFLGGNTNLL